MRILIAVRAEASSAELAQALRADGHACDQVESEEATVGALLSSPFDFAVVDLGLGVPPGPTMIGRLRAKAIQTPILSLALSQSPAERAAALERGSDDCVGVPVDVSEIRARVRAWTRRAMGSASNMIRHGPLRFDTAERTVYIEGQQVQLSRRELSLLEILISRRGRFVSKDRMAEIMFGWGEEVTTNTIEVYVHRLRKKIESGPVRIRSSRGVGYQLERITG
jgi:two-component system, OmpR family, response regulator